MRITESLCGGRLAWRCATCPLKPDAFGEAMIPESVAEVKHVFYISGNKRQLSTGVEI
jgi:hypothetical protein